MPSHPLDLLEGVFRNPDISDAARRDEESGVSSTEESVSISRTLISLILLSVSAIVIVSKAIVADVG